ncbi:MAG: nickel-responsive transcriptional regulator NikR [Deltaproteobacteria bacterium]|nr:nickel-responsive transcriptional regulator NikR [Deltaproteobacteria bacterium]
MSEIVRTSFSIDRGLLDEFESMVNEGNYKNRSEFLRGIIRQRLSQRAKDRDEVVVGAVLIIYDHHIRGLTSKIVDLQHEQGGSILATTHVHMTHRLCAEVIIARDRAGRLESLADELGRLKGVLHASFTFGAT